MAEPSEATENRELNGNVISKSGESGGGIPGFGMGIALTAIVGSGQFARHNNYAFNA